MVWAKCSLFKDLDPLAQVALPLQQNLQQLGVITYIPPVPQGPWQNAAPQPSTLDPQMLTRRGHTVCAFLQNWDPIFGSYMRDRISFGCI